MEEHVVQPLLVSTSAFQLAAETVRSILKIDDIVSFLSIWFHLDFYVIFFFFLGSRTKNIKTLVLVT